jgi:hypothetical protein
MTRTNKRIKQGNTRKIKIITILQLYQRESFFQELSDRNKFIWLLSNEDREICKNLANFIATCLSIRDLSDK